MSRFLPFILVTLAVGLGSSLDALIKALAQDLPVLTVILARYACGSLVALAVFFVARGRWPDRRGLRFHLLRGLVQLCAGISFFWSLTQLGLAEVTVLGFTAALYVGPLAFLLLKEPMSRVAAMAVAVGFIGALIAGSGAPSGPAEGNRVLGILAILLSAAFYALSLVLIRMRARQDGAMTVVVFSNVVPAAGLLLLALGAHATGWGAVQFVLPPVTALLPLGMTGVMGVLVWWLYTSAFMRAPAGRLAPFEYSSLLWAAALGFLVFGEVPGWPLYIGSTLIIGACLAVALEGRFATRRGARLPSSDIVE